MHTTNKFTQAFILTQILGTLLIGFLSQPSLAANFPEPGDAAQGAKTWADNCTRCHNMRSPTDLSDEQWVTSAFHMRVRAGLTGQETRDILSFLQASNNETGAQPSAVALSLQSTVMAATAARDGRETYESSCIACHGANGKGSLPGVPDFTEAAGRLTQSDDVLLRNIINGMQSPGSPMPMPARGGNLKLSDADLSAVLEYVRESFNP